MKRKFWVCEILSDDNAEVKLKLMVETGTPKSARNRAEDFAGMYPPSAYAILEVFKGERKRDK